MLLQGAVASIIQNDLTVNGSKLKAILRGLSKVAIQLWFYIKTLYILISLLNHKSSYMG